MRPWTMGVEFLDRCTFGVNNYVLVKPLTTLVSICCAVANKYGDGQFRPDVAYPYITFVDSTSQARTRGGYTAETGARRPRRDVRRRRWQMWALYCLLLVYIHLHDQIAPIRPTLKFLCVKGVVFATFWQARARARPSLLCVQTHTPHLFENSNIRAFRRLRRLTSNCDQWDPPVTLRARSHCVFDSQGMLLSMLLYAGVLTRLNAGWNWKCEVHSNDVVNALQNFLISTEMLVFAVLHAYAFPSREYRDERLPPRRAAARLTHMFDVRDVYDDVTRCARRTHAAR